VEHWFIIVSRGTLVYYSFTWNIGLSWLFLQIIAKKD